jgi:hypothetical protein
MTMAYEHLKDSALPRAVLEVMADLADLVQKELRLARKEFSEKLSIKIRGGLWMAIAGLAGFFATLVLIEALVFGIASAGIALHWSCLIVAGLLALTGAIAYAKGRSDLAGDLMPRRTLNSIKQDATVAKEQLR